MSADLNAADFIEWDVSNWAAALEYWRKHSTKDLAACDALELGCNYGGLSLWLASEGARVTSTDLNGPRPEAVEKYHAYGFAGNIRCEAVNALDIPYTEAFDIVVFKSILGVIGDPCTPATQAAAIAQIYKALRPGGELYFAENLEASPIHRFLRRKFVRWGATWRYPSMDEMIRYLDVFPNVQFGTFGVTGAFGRTESQRSMLATVDHAIFDRVSPSSWKYIIAGVARK